MSSVTTRQPLGDAMRPPSDLMARVSSLSSVSAAVSYTSPWTPGSRPPRLAATVRSARARNIDAVPVSTNTRPRRRRISREYRTYSFRWSWPRRPWPVFAVEETADRHQGAVAGEALDAGGEEAVVEHGVGVHAHDDVVVAETVEESAQRLVERARLLVGVADGDEHLRPVRSRDGFGRIGAVVGHDDDAVRRRVLGTERVERRSDGGGLVVGGDEDGDRDRSAEDATGLGHHELGGEQLHLGIGRAPGSVHDNPFDEGHAGGEEQTETDGADHDGEGRRLGVVEDVPHAEQCPRLRGLIDRGGARRHGEPQQERSTDRDACDDQSDVAAEPATGVTAPGGPDIVVAWPEPAGPPPDVASRAGWPAVDGSVSSESVVPGSGAASRAAAFVHDIHIGRIGR